VYRPGALPPVAPSKWAPTSSADEAPRERVPPRRALPSPTDMGSEQVMSEMDVEVLTMGRRRLGL
jgi:hypothetical protein